MRQTACVGSQQFVLTLTLIVPIACSRLAGKTSGSTSSRPCSRAVTGREGWGLVVAGRFNPIHSNSIMLPIEHKVEILHLQIFKLPYVHIITGVFLSISVSEICSSILCFWTGVIHPSLKKQERTGASTVMPGMCRGRVKKQYKNMISECQIPCKPATCHVAYCTCTKL